jgi:hypothetical protein
MRLIQMQLHGIEIYSEPRRGSVRRVQNLKTSWYLKHLPLGKPYQQMTIDQAFKESIKKDPALMAEFMTFQADVETVQNIMLATTLTYDDVLELEDMLTVKEFDEFVEACKNVAGGVQDFSNESGSDINSKNPENTTENNSSTNLPDQPGGSTQE